LFVTFGKLKHGLSNSPNPFLWSGLNFSKNQSILCFKARKKAHLSEDYDKSKDPATSIKALTKDQLVSLISDVMKANPGA
jgi:hypothetical protein